MADAIVAGDQARLFAAVEPAIQADPSLVAWLGTPGVGVWLDGYLARVRAVLMDSDDASALPPITTAVGDDPII